MHHVSETEPSKALPQLSGRRSFTCTPFETWQIDFIQMPPLGGPSRHSPRCPRLHLGGRRAMAQSAGELLLGKVIPLWGVPAERPGEREVYFTGQVIKETCKIGPLRQCFHCACHPHPHSALGHGTKETQLLNPWRLWPPRPKAPPLVFLRLTSTLWGNTVCLP